jgi:hypothetical protein
MFEISIFCVIVLAIGYWVALWLMGRHDDVLHGDFVQGEQASRSVSAASAVSAAPVIPAKLSPPRLASNADTLQSLLTSIKRDLKDAAQI